MKKVICLMMTCLLLVITLPSKGLQAADLSNDMRAVWISTVFNLDYPSTKNNPTQQQQEFISKLEAVQEMGLNTVIVQIRPKADALYQSSINPWSDVLTGVQGKDPGYDPLAFMIEETHKRGMAFHAWLNPYRVTTSGTDLSVLSNNHPARLHPEWTISYNNKLYYNPESEGVKQHIVDTVKEIAINYDVDGIHFDDYFYPSGYPLPSTETRDGVTADMRREAVNDMVKRVSSVIDTVNTTYHKSVSFGISPPGIWKNTTSDLSGSKTAGNEAYYSVYADSRTWIQNDWIDYIVPQIYWKIGHSKADYETLVKWWSNEVAGTNVKLYIGQGIYSEEVAVQIDEQLKLNQDYPLVKGSIYFSLRNLINNTLGCKDKIQNFYEQSNAIVPPMDSFPEINPPTVIPPENPPTITPPVNNDSIGASPEAIGKTGIVTSNSLNIRSGAREDREIVATIPKDTQVKILDTLGNWYKVRLANGVVGWCSAQYLKISDTIIEETIKPIVPPISVFPSTVEVTASSLNVRTGARVDRPLICKLTKGTKVTALSELNGWYKVRLADQTIGWVSGEYVALSSTSSGSATFPRTATVTATALNMRVGARTDRALITTLKKGTKVTLLDSLGEWYKLKLSDGRVGWAIKAYLV